MQNKNLQSIKKSSPTIKFRRKSMLQAVSYIVASLMNWGALNCVVWCPVTLWKLEPFSTSTLKALHKSISMKSNSIKLFRPEKKIFIWDSLKFLPIWKAKVSQACKIVIRNIPTFSKVIWIQISCQINFANLLQTSNQLNRFFSPRVYPSIPLLVLFGTELGKFIINFRNTFQAYTKQLCVLACLWSI